MSDEQSVSDLKNKRGPCWGQFWHMSRRVCLQTAKFKFGWTSRHHPFMMRSFVSIFNPKEHVPNTPVTSTKASIKARLLSWILQIGSLSMILQLIPLSIGDEYENRNSYLTSSHEVPWTFNIAKTFAHSGNIWSGHVWPHALGKLAAIRASLHMHEIIWLTGISRSRF